MMKDKLLSLLAKPEVRTAIFLGGTDTGKTTLIERLLKDLVPRYSVAVVDCDVGQSHVGPPTTIGWCTVSGRFDGWDSISLGGFYFVGAVSPEKHLCPMVDGARIMCAEARSTAEKVLVDTTGFIHGPSAKDLKHSKIDAIAPDAVVAVQREGELDHIVRRFEEPGGPALLSLPVAEEVQDNTAEQRHAYRTDLFRRYFKGSHHVEVDLRQAPLRSVSGAREKVSGDLLGRIVSLRNASHSDVALGRIIEYEAKPPAITVETPAPDSLQVGSVVLGNEELL